MRQPGRSRRAILEAGFWEIYRQGFRAARVEAILSGTGLTKGALYHHFPTKTALGSAVVDDVIRPRVRDWWLEPLASAPDPIDGLLRVVRGLERDDAPEMLVGGCPVFNLLQELAGVDEPFRRNLVAVLDEWRDAIAAALARGQAAGTVRADLHPDVTAAFLISTYHGLAGTAKAHRSPTVARRLLRSFVRLIETLRAGASPGAAV
jgi:AcrR family transcriptional regulator